MKVFKNQYFIIGTVFLLLFILFSYFVHQDLFTGFDFNSTVKLQDRISHRFDLPFSTLSLIGSFEISCMILLSLWLLIRKARYILVLFSFAFFHFLEIIGKTFIVHTGPPFMFFRYEIPFLFPSSYVSPGFSYPSGHAARTIFISIILGFLINKSKMPKAYKKALLLIVIAFDVLMLISRVYLAEHWTSDVIGGSLLGAAFALISLIFI